MQEFSIIVAHDDKRGIGKNGGLPWHLPPDLQHFKEITSSTDDPQKINAVIMGRKTWESIPEKFRPLPKRLNVVLTRNKNLAVSENVLIAGDFIGALNLIEQKGDVESIFVIGGEQVFTAAITLPQCTSLFVTCISDSFNCDTFFPTYDNFSCRTQLSEIQEFNGLRYQFFQFAR